MATQTNGATEAKATANAQGRAAGGSVSGGRHNGAGERVRSKSISVDDDVELAVPVHKLRLDGSPEVGKRKANAARQQLKAMTPEVSDREAFTYKKIEALDTNDPNYDPADHIDDVMVDMEVIVPEHSPLAQRKALDEPLKEFFENGDFEDFMENMLEIDTSEQMRMWAVVVAVEAALDRDDECRDLVSRLLVEMTTTHTVSESQMMLGFDMLLANVDNMALDNPHAGQLLASFIGKAIADDVLPPAYVKSRLELGDASARDVVRLASVRINMPHGLVRLDSVWSGGACRRSATQLTEHLGTMLREYVDCVDLKEAERQIRAWAVPHFHHEIVFEAVVMALEYGNVPGPESEQRVDRLTAMLCAFTASGLISDDQVQLGFDRVLRGLPDLMVDIPSAKRDMVTLVKQGIQDRYLPPEFAQKIADMAGH